MLKEESVQVLVTPINRKHYESLGYDIPLDYPIKSYSKDGVPCYGKEKILRKGTTITVPSLHLPKGSNVKVTNICSICGKETKMKYCHFVFLGNKDYCKKCLDKERSLNKTTHVKWTRELIHNNPHAACDISGETNKQFLCLHHLLSTSAGGSNSRDNYVILSANYHQAFHSWWMGSVTVPSTPDDYYAFKEAIKNKQGFEITDTASSSHGDYINKLIKNNPQTHCDISKETDKRFLELHHLTSRSKGGRNTLDNYVVLSANYHKAFHVWMGGPQVPTTKEDYIKFKNEVLNDDN